MPMPAPVLNILQVCLKLIATLPPFSSTPQSPEVFYMPNPLSMAAQDSLEAREEEARPFRGANYQQLQRRSAVGESKREYRT